MPNRKETSIDIKNLIIKLHKEGKPLRKIGEYLGKTHSTIQYIIKNIWQPIPWKTIHVLGAQRN